MAIVGGIAAAMVGSVFSSVAWENVTFVSGEIDNPKKNVVRSMVVGTSAVMILYLLVNFIYLNTLNRDGIAFAPNDRVAVVVSEQIFGNGVGTYIMAVLVMISTFGCINGLVLAGARVFQTMAKDGMFLKPR
jgi:APA family basic amino acid/polyamine antiporter